MDNRNRFTDRVDAYVKYRPSYPAEAIDFLYDAAGFRESDTIADVGAGTGIFSRLLLERGSFVVSLEPNAAMRAAAVQQCGDNERCRLLPGAAEETGLPSLSVDHIVCAQSFHWFDREAARKEFGRILKPGGIVALIWNTRRSTGSPFLEQFEQLLLDFGTDYVKVGHKSITNETLIPFFGGDGPQLGRFKMRQLFDEDGIAGRLQSSSYCPLPGSSNYEAMRARLKAMFAEQQEDGKVALEYETELYWGKILPRK